ncbi:MAG: hypothetical protein LBF22_06980, partial [Deltaproteobacteria bacterium]|nr:hypothetical protein [Deltaproteobacteria bacterium]
NSKLGDHFLNVAITRAKVNLKLVTSISPEKVDVSALNHDGIKHLIKYLDFAKNGPPAIFKGKSTVGEPKGDFQFEESVYNFLVSKGYSVVKFVGLSPIKIDLAIRHPKRPDVFLCGILCDGLSYKIFKNANERDNLRETILRNLGWEIYRIWSATWINDFQNEAKELVSYIEHLIQLAEGRTEELYLREDPFTKLLYDFVISKGYSANKDTRYLFDLIISHPQKPGVLLCGIRSDSLSYYHNPALSCSQVWPDGRHYHPGQPYLMVEANKRGFESYNVWSDNWINNPEDEARKLLSFLKKLKKLSQK